jgi:NADH/F420H2 dehydrogenase subunit C
MTDESKDKGQEQPAGAAQGVPAKPIPPKAPPPKPAAAAPAPPAGPTDPPPPADLAVPEYVAALQTALPDAIERVSYWVGDWTVIVPAARLLEVGRFLRDAPGIALDYCSDLTAVDWPVRPQRFDLVYCLYSTRYRHRLRVKVRTAERNPVPSVTGLWPGANWLEREVYDLFGVDFTGHPDLRRILLPDDWQGHPERKDYPLEGPGELIIEGPVEWLKLHQLEEEEESETE